MTDDFVGTSRDRCAHCGGWVSMGHAAGSACRGAREVDNFERLFVAGRIDDKEYDAQLDAFMHEANKS